MKTHPLVNIALAAAEHEAYAYQGVRKIINGVAWSLDWNPVETLRWEDDRGEKLGIKSLVSFDQLGYGRNKFKQLVRNYVNEEEFARVRTVLERRAGKSFTSVALSMRGRAKDARSMGWCILSIVVTRHKGEERVEVQYRSTELTLKFGGDLCFLPWVFDQIGVNPKMVTFRFANCYLSGVYLPYLVTFASDPVSLLYGIKNRDETFFASASRFFLRSATKRDQFFPYSPENVAHKFGWEHIPAPTMKRIREFLAEYHKKFGPLTWIQHHRKGEYVPRGQRQDDDSG